jgi:hypothetical protein
VRPVRCPLYVEGCNFRFTQSANLVIFGIARLKYQSMKFTVCVVFLFFTANLMGAQGTAAPAQFDVNAAERFANLALACVQKEYPNKISHTLNSDADVAQPRKLTPAFFGCYDWHSSVHGHWLLVRLVKTFPGAPFVPSAREALRQSLTADNVAQEAAYLRCEGRASFERPYGLAWLLLLVAELREWKDRGPTNGCEPAPSVTGCTRTSERLAAQAFPSGADRRA